MNPTALPLVALALLLGGCADKSCFRMTHAADRAAEEAAKAPALDVSVPWTEIGDAQRKLAEERARIYREAGTRASLSGVFAGPLADVNRGLADAYRGVGASYDRWLKAASEVAAKRDAAIQKARAALALVQAYDAVCLAERPADLPEPKPVPWGVPQKQNFVACSKIDLAAAEGAMKTGDGLGDALAQIEAALTPATEDLAEADGYEESVLTDYEARRGKAREALLVVQEARTAVTTIDGAATALEDGRKAIDAQLAEVQKLHDEAHACDR